MDINRSLMDFYGLERILGYRIIGEWMVTKWKKRNFPFNLD